MKNNRTKLFLVLSLILITMVGVSAVSATDLESSDSNQLEETSNTAVSSHDIVTSDNDYTKINNNKSVLTQNELRGPFDTNGSFSDLNTLISESSGDLTLDKNYVKGSDESEIVIDGKTITIDGNGAVIDLNQNYFVFNITETSTVSLKNMIIQNINGPEGILNYGTLNLDNVTFLNNNVPYNNAHGLVVTNNSKITVNNSHVYNNNATYGLFELTNSATGTFENSDFANNSGNNGVLYGTRYSYANITVNNCNFTNNSKSNYGGAINSYGGYAYVYNSTFVNNSAGTRGGAIYLNGEYGLVENSIFEGNYLTSTGKFSLGGAICVNTEVYFHNNTMINNYGLNGTDIYVESGSVNYAVLTFEDVTGSVDDIVLVKGILTDDNNNTISGQNITINIDSLSTRVTPYNGTVTFEVAGTLEPGNYTITGTYSGITEDVGELLVNTGNLEITPSLGLNYASVEQLVQDDTTGTVTLDNFVRRGLAEGNITINKTITIDGNGNTLDQVNGSAFIVENGATLTIKNLIVTNAATSYNTVFNPSTFETTVSGSMGAFIEVKDGSLVLDNVTVVNSTGDNYGSNLKAALVLVDENCYASINNTLFENNTVAAIYIKKNLYGSAHASGIINNTIIRNTNAGNDENDQGWIINGGKLDIYNSIFENNIAQQGGIYGGLQQEPMIIQNTTFINNTVRVGSGGAIQQGNTLTVINSTFIGNKATKTGLDGRGGGAIYSSGDLTVTGSLFFNNTSTGEGTIIENYHGSLNVTNSVLVPSGTKSAIYNIDEYSSSVVVNNNWWGTNENPAQYVKSGTYYDEYDEQCTSDPVVVDKWVLMNASYEETESGVYRIITTFNQTIDADGNINDLEGNIPDGLEVNYDPIVYTYTENPSYTVDSVATTTVNGPIKKIKVIQSNQIIDFLNKATEAQVHIINDGNYTYYFNDDGTVNEEIIAPGSELQFDGEFYDRDIVVTMPLNLTTYTTQAVFHNTSIIIDDVKANGTNITDIIVNNTNYSDAILEIICVKDITVKNSTFTQYNDDGYTRGVQIDQSINVLLDGNNITTVGPDIDVNYDLYPISIVNTAGIEVTNSSKVVIKNSNVITNKTGNSTQYGTINGIYVHKNSSYAVIDNNTVITESEAYTYSIPLMEGAFDSNVTNNNITTISKKYANAIEFGGEARRNIAKNNTINVTAEEMTYAFYVSTNGNAGVDNNIIVNNNVTATASSNYIVELWSVYSTTIANNTFNAVGDYSLGIGSYNTRRSTIVNNTMNLTGNAQKDPVENDNILVETVGVKLVGDSNANDIKLNNITIQTLVQEAYAVNLTSGRYNTITDNYFVAKSASGTLIGDTAVLNSDEENTVENNTPVPPTEIIVTNDNYYDYFDEEGNFIAQTQENPIIKLSGEIYNKNFTFTRPVNVITYDTQGVLINTTVQFLEGSDNSNFTSIVINNNNFTDRAIYVTDVENITLSNNNITAYNDNSIHGIVLNKTSGNIIKDNNLNVSGIAQPVYYPSMMSMFGMSNTSSILLYNSSNNIIETNNITTTANTASDNADTIVGIEIAGENDYNQMKSYNSDNNTINNNNIITSGVTHAYAIKNDGFTNENKITNNTINNTADSVYGVFIDGEAYNTTIQGNNINLTSNEFAYGIVLQNYEGLFIGTQVDSNNITATSGAVYGIELYRASYVNVTNNTINAQGNYSTGIAEYGSDFGNITNNTITTTGDNNAQVPTSADIITPTNTAIQLISSEFNNITGNYVNATIANSNGTYAVNANGTYNKIINNTLYTPDKRGNGAVNATNTSTVKDNLPLQLDVTLNGTNITGTVNNPITITVTVTDENENNVNEGTVIFTDAEGKIIGQAEVTEGTASINKTFDSYYNDTITANYTGSTTYNTASTEITVLINKLDTNIKIMDIETIKVDDNVTISVILTSDDKLLSDETITITVNNKTLTNTTENGIAQFTIEFNDAGDYEIVASYEGSTVYNGDETNTTLSVEALNTIIEANTTSTVKYGANVTINGIVKDENNKLLEGIDVIIYVNGVAVANVTTDADGTFTYDYTTDTLGLNEVFIESVATTNYNANNYTLNFGVETLNVTITGVDVTGTTLSNVTIVVSVVDENGEAVNEGTVVFTDANGNVLGSAGVVNGSASLTTVFNKAYNDTVTVSYAESGIYSAGEGSVNVTISIIASTVTINPVEGVIGEVTTIVANVLDANGNPVNGGRIVFKYNGKTLKDADGNVVQANVVNGVATVDFVVPDSWRKAGNLSAKYGGTSAVDTTDSETVVPVTSLRNATITVSPQANTAEAGDSVIYVVIVSDEKTGTLINGVVVVKMAGVTIGQVNVVNGVGIFNYTIPTSRRAGDYNMSFVFSNSTYNRAQNDDASLTVKLSQVRLEAPAVVVRGNETGVVKAQILYTNTGEVINTPVSVAIKVNGKTVHSSRYSNGNIEFELPSSYRDGSTITIAVGATYRTAALRKEIQYIKMK